MTTAWYSGAKRTISPGKALRAATRTEEGIPVEPDREHCGDRKPGEHDPRRAFAAGDPVPNPVSERYRRRRPQAERQAPGRLEIVHAEQEQRNAGQRPLKRRPTSRMRVSVMSVLPGKPPALTPRPPFSHIRRRMAAKPPLDILLASRAASAPGSSGRSMPSSGRSRCTGAPVYVRHEIVHNQYVVERLKAIGAVFVASSTRPRTPRRR